MKRWRVWFVAVVGASSVITTTLVSRHHQRVREQQIETEREATKTLADLASTNRWLSNQLASSDRARQLQTNALDIHESEREALRKKKAALELKADSLASSEPLALVIAQTMDELKTLSTAKLRDAHILAIAVAKHPFRHSGRYPTNLDQVVGALTNNPDFSFWTGTNRFEIVYVGTQQELTNIPWNSIAVIRERHPWKGPNGRLSRVYGMADGRSEMIESDDNFRSWESAHIIPAAGQLPP